MRSVLNKTETLLLAAGLAMLVAAGTGAPVHDVTLQHEFAERRIVFGVLNAYGVLSTAAFLVAAAAGGIVLMRTPRRCLTNMQRAMALLFFSGLGLAAIGAAAYQLDPTNATLGVERYCAAFTFAGLLGLAAAGHVGERAAGAIGMAMLAGGIAAAKVFAGTGNVLPWTVVQFGGVTLLWCIALLQPRLRSVPVNWAMVLLAGTAAKLLAIHDHAVFAFTGHLVAGMALSHVAGAFAAWPVIAAIARVAKERRELPRAPFVTGSLVAA
jgi:hypothetical protein